MRPPHPPSLTHTMPTRKTNRRSRTNAPQVEAPLVPISMEMISNLSPIEHNTSNSSHIPASPNKHQTTSKSSPGKRKVYSLLCLLICRSVIYPMIPKTPISSPKGHSITTYRPSLTRLAILRTLKTLIPVQATYDATHKLSVLPSLTTIDLCRTQKPPCCAP